MVHLERSIQISAVIARSEATKQSILSSWDDGLLRGACHRAALRADPLARNDGINYLSCHFGSRFSMKAPMPSSASRAIMFSVITSAA